MNAQVAIIGGGEIGKAIERLCRSGTVLGIVDHDESKSTLPNKESLLEADVIFVCVPSEFVRQAIKENLEYLKTGVLIIALTKGVEKGTNELVPEIFAELLPENPFALLSGPMIAEEIMAGERVSAFVASESKEAFETAKNILDDNKISLEYTNEVKAVALLATLKNVYAIGLGILGALGSGANVTAVFVTKALKEMDQILKNEGASTALTYNLPGLGDLLATGSSPNSKNRCVGEFLVEKRQFSASEGMRTLEYMKARLGDISPLPLFSALQAIVVDKSEEPETLITALLHA